MTGEINEYNSRIEMCADKMLQELKAKHRLEIHSTNQEIFTWFAVGWLARADKIEFLKDPYEGSRLGRKLFHHIGFGDPMDVIIVLKHGNSSEVEEIKFPGVEDITIKCFAEELYHNPMRDVGVLERTLYYVAIGWLVKENRFILFGNGHGYEIRRI